MGKVSISVNGRDFAVGCKDGEEESVAALGRRFEAHVSDLVAQVGQIGDLRLFLMAALVLADELRESEATCEALKGQIADLKSRSKEGRNNHSHSVQKAIESLLNAATRAEDIASQLEKGAKH